MHKNTAYNPLKKGRGDDKLAHIPIKIEPTLEPLRKPDWIRISLKHTARVAQLKKLLRDKQLVTVCEEAACPNLNECFSHGTATFMIMGDKCTRRCSFCAVGHGRPDPLNPNEPHQLAEAIHALALRYVVITSVDRDDLADGGAGHFAACLRAVREKNPSITVEILVPDFRGRMEKALTAFNNGLPDVFNHNIETVPRLYSQARPGSDFYISLQLLQTFKQRFPGIPTKSGIMLGLGETQAEIRDVLQALRQHDVDLLTVGQYLQPSHYHMPVTHYVTPHEFTEWATVAKTLGFTNVASGPLVRSSYHADRQAAGEHVA